jgi:AraC family transcriptional regulator
MSPASPAQSASRVDPESIASSTTVGIGAELLVRCRPPGGVDLVNGQREHMLMSTVGSPFDGKPVRSVLRTNAGRREWNDCPTGHVTFVQSGFPIEWDWSYKSESVHLIMLPSFLNEVGNHFERQDGEVATLKPFFRVLDHDLNALLHQLSQESAKDSIGKDLVTSSLLYLIAARVYRMSNAKPQSPDTARETASFSALDCQRSIELLNDRLDEKISLSELAGEFGLSPYYFSRVFKRMTGFPPHEYQLQLRIARAREMLRRHPVKTITEIACELGFSDESHFRRHFRRIVGTTPSRFRQQQ